MLLPAKFHIHRCTFCL